MIKNLTAVISAIAAALCVLLLVLILCGFRPYILESSSMEPVFPVGSLCWINTRVSLDELEVGDPVVYRSPVNTLVLHRLVGIDDSGAAIMQGDANELAQSIELSHINYIGREAFSIPFMGAAIKFLLKFVWPFIAALFLLACMPWEKVIQRRAAKRSKEDAL